MPMFLFIRGGFKMSCSEKFYIAVTQFQYFETSIASVLKQALIVYKIKFY
jgi:hypothetical protein